MFQLQLAATVFVVESWLSTGTRTRLVSVNRVYLRPVKKAETGNLRVIRLLSSLDAVNVFCTNQSREGLAGEYLVSDQWDTSKVFRKGL